MFVIVAGFCIKTWKENSDDKVFVNICHTEHIPPPPDDITDIQLIEMLYNADEYADGSFRIPMSIGESHMESDKGGSFKTLFCFKICMY